MNAAILQFKQDRGRLFWIFALLFIIACVFFVPFLGLLFLGLYLNEKINSKPIKIILLVLGILLATVLNVFSILSFFKVGPDSVNNLFYGSLYWYSEFFHTTSLIFFVYSFYRIFRYSNTPYSFFYVGIHQFIHAIYKGCPITQLQNYLVMGTNNITPVPNTYWRGLFGEFSEPMRMAFLAMSMLFLYRAYTEYMKFDIPVKEWLSCWKEGKYEKPSHLVVYDSKQAH